MISQSRLALSLILRSERCPGKLFGSSGAARALGGRGTASELFASSYRSFSSKGPNDDDEKNLFAMNEDLFGMNEDHGQDGVGEKPPLRAERQNQNLFSSGELSDADKALLYANDDEQETTVVNRLSEHLVKGATSKDTPLNKAGRRIRESEAALNRLGRKPSEVSSETIDGKETYDEPLSEKEFSSFASFLKKEKGIHTVTPDDIPTKERSNTYASSTATSEEDELASKWLTARAARQMDDSVDDNPYSDIMPGDLSPSNLVNRKRAKYIPKEFMHHQNLHLLQMFVDPITALIRPRVQTRLGARDQRKIAKLIKRARNMGLIPNSKQFKVERTGWLHDDDIDRKREWEVQLEEAGLSLPEVTAEKFKDTGEEKFPGSSIP